MAWGMASEQLSYSAAKLHCSTLLKPSFTDLEDGRERGSILYRAVRPAVVFGRESAPG